MCVPVTAADSDDIHPVDSNLYDNAALELTKPSSRSAVMCCDQCGKWRSTKPWICGYLVDDFDKDNGAVASFGDHQF
eukprot:SAG31_NODE_36828_length_310_cov_0.312796_1_plen_76_part_01